MRNAVRVMPFAVVALLGIDALAIEPYAVETTHSSLPTTVRAPLVVAHLSDLHTHGYGRRERRVVEALAAEHPDVIVITGDTIDDGAIEPARALFEHMSAPLGVWVVRGNWEDWKPPPNEQAFYASVGAHLLVNEGVRLRDDVWLAGLDDPSSGTSDLSAAMRNAPPHVTRIAIFHSPEEFDGFAPSIDVAFAGHTHGGQVRFPFVGALYVPGGSGRFEHGWYTSGDAHLYVSRGIGTSVLPIRFLCPPEVAMVTLRSK